MVNFIIGEDDKHFMALTEDVITKYMMKNQIEYKIHRFDDYGPKFRAMINRKLPFKIYILDIETPSGSGLDMARLIRNRDVDSVIIFLTGHQELSHIAIKNEFLFLSYINKFDECEKHLEQSIEKALQILKTKKIIRFKDCGTIYTVALDDILYVTKETNERKIILRTEYATFKLSKSLGDFYKMLNGNFVQTHRACIVNTKRIVSYNKSKKIITFDNGEKIDLVSSRFEGELI